MGYYIRTQDCDLRISAEHFDALHARLCEMDKRDELKGGGSWGVSEKDKESWFSWVRTDWTTACDTVVKVFEEFRFEVEQDYKGNIVGLSFDCKQGDELTLLAYAAKYIEDGSYLEWVTEDNAMYRTVFRDGEMLVAPAVVSFPEETTYTCPTWHYDQEGRFVKNIFIWDAKEDRMNPHLSLVISEAK